MVCFPNLPYIYPSRIGFRFSEPDFTRTLDFSQSQNPRLSIAKPLVLFNRKIKIHALQFLKPLRNGHNNSRLRDMLDMDIYLIDSDKRIRLTNSCRYPNVSLPVEDIANLMMSS